MPQLPASLHVTIREVLDRDRLRRMPNLFLPCMEYGSERDFWNMRYPLTGGGMTIALNDAVILTRMLGKVESYSNWNQVSDALARWH